MNVVTLEKAFSHSSYSDYSGNDHFRNVTHQDNNNDNLSQHL